MKSDLFKLIISNKKNDDALIKSLKLYRIFCFLGAILIPGYWFFHNFANPSSIDYLTLRLILSLHLLLFLLLLIQADMLKTI
jgi:hypothetical protein